MISQSEATHTFPAAAKLLYEILTDYDTYAEWMPLVRHSTLLAREADLVIAELEIAPPNGGKVLIEGIHSKSKRQSNNRPQSAA